jgi:hypothetical protein
MEDYLDTESKIKRAQDNMQVFVVMMTADQTIDYLNYLSANLEEQSDELALEYAAMIQYINKIKK